MKTIKGQATCSDSGDIPSGSVVLVYVCKGAETVGRQTFQNLTQFPIQFNVQLSNLSDQDHDLIVNVENGENLLFTNGKTKIDQSQSLENLNIEVKRIV
ncbi:hypothetical protein BpHYR1_014084 [Brachionus plicatilis]|uniref:Uncharacterized protein n=1 Tax=Brachionus plicatilis TaxID=10195 RepID=A0A3M7SGH8_BRAPC|nr:hypothetical protein BpHYR1_014084 [Brachionus plicatilis]